VNAVKLFFEGYHHNESEKLQVTTAKESQNVTPFPLRKSQETRSVLRGARMRVRAQEGPATADKDGRFLPRHCSAPVTPLTGYFQIL
jgi:hypothetical protein